MLINVAFAVDATQHGQLGGMDDAILAHSLDPVILDPDQPACLPASPRRRRPKPAGLDQPMSSRCRATCRDLQGQAAGRWTRWRWVCSSSASAVRPACSPTSSAPTEYTATVRLGVRATTTDDAEGEVVEVRDASGITEAALDAAVAALTGPILQVPELGLRDQGRRRAGVRACGRGAGRTSARPSPWALPTCTSAAMSWSTGQSCSTSTRPVVCSSGTAVSARSRGRQRGARRSPDGTAAQVGGLVSDAGTHLDENATAEPERRCPCCRWPTRRARRSRCTLDEDEVRALSYGQSLAPVPGGPAGTVAAMAPDGTLVALVEGEGARAPGLVFAPAST